MSAARFRFSSTYNGEPFWLSEGAELGRPEFADLPISKDLADQIQRWNAIYSEMLDWEDPMNKVDTPLERELHYLCGLSLAQRLANSLEQDVYFFDSQFLTEDLKFSPGAI